MRRQGQQGARARDSVAAALLSTLPLFGAGCGETVDKLPPLAKAKRLAAADGQPSSTVAVPEADGPAADGDSPPSPPPAPFNLPPDVPPRPTGPLPGGAEAAKQASEYRKECFDVAEDLLAAAPADAAGWTLLGAVHAYYGDAEAAERLWRRAIEVDPHAADPHRFLGDAALRRDDVAGAEREYRLALDADPEAIGLVGKLAETLLREGDTTAAIDLLLVFLAGRPSVAQGWCLLGKARLMEAKIGPARKAFERALEIDASSRDARRGMGFVAAQLGKSDPEPSTVELTDRLEDRRDSARPDQRIEAAGGGAARPWTATVNYWAAVHHARLGDSTQAGLRWRRALDLSPDDNDSREALASLYAEVGRTRDAIRLRREWCDREPVNPAAWFGMGKLALALGLPEEAAAALRTVVALAPERPEGYALLARALMTLDPKASLDAARMAANLDPTSDHWALVGDLLLRSGQRQEAIAAYERAMALDPADDRARLAYERIRSIP